MTTSTPDPRTVPPPASGRPGRAVRRVLVVANAYPDEERPGYGAYVHTAVRGLRAAGLDVDVLAVRGYRGKQEYVRGVRGVLALNARPRGYDVVHAYYGLMGMVARLQVRVPLVITFTGGDIQGDRDEQGRPVRSSLLKARAYLQTARAAAATTTQTEAMAALLPPAARARNRVINVGVDLGAFGRLTRAQARAELGWPADERTVIFVADPSRQVKNFPLAEAAVERLRRERAGVRLRVAGDVPHSEVPTWMAAADALVLTSRSEGSPNVVKEAMAAGLPAVSTPVGDVPRLFDGVPGCFIREPEPAALAEGLAAALDHGRTPAAQAAIAPLGLERYTEQVIDLYEHVARR
jgi:glycosyltransferase involved in cell wall biosynthesis